MARKLAVLVTGAVLLVAACTTETRTTNETSSNAPEGSAVHTPLRRARTPSTAPAWIWVPSLVCV